MFLWLSCWLACHTASYAVPLHCNPDHGRKMRDQFCLINGSALNVIGAEGRCYAACSKCLTGLLLLTAKCFHPCASWPEMANRRRTLVIAPVCRSYDPLRQLRNHIETSGRS